VALWIATLAGHSNAAPGDLDPDLGGFGTGGSISTPGFQVNAAVIDAEGRLVLAGTRLGNFFVERRSGPRSASSQSVSVPISGGSDARAVAIAPDGKIVVAGFRPDQQDFALARLNPDLTPDGSFSGDGIQVLQLADGAGSSQANGVVVQTLCGPPPRGCDHRITAVGFAWIGGVLFGDPDFAAARLNEDGTLDASFDGDGKWTKDFDGQPDRAYAVVAQSDGKLLIGGVARIGTVLPDDDFAILRLNLDGSTDSSFGPGLGLGGAFGLSTGGHDGATSLAIGPDGKIVLAGDLFGQYVEVVRLTPNASEGVDSTFGDNGRVFFTPPGGGEIRANAVVVQGDGKVVVAGGGETIAPFLLRYTDAGQPDPSFGTGGRATSPNGSGSISAWRALVLQSDGMLVAAGASRAERYRWGGALDSGGILSLRFDPAHSGSEATGLAAAPDGRLVAAGKVFVGGGYRTALARFLTSYRDGLDPSFDGDGRALYDSGGSSEEPRALALQTDGKAVTVGQIFNPLPVPNLNFLVRRANPEGTPDLACDADGRNALDFGSSRDDTAAAVALGPDNRIYAAGTVIGPSGTGDFGLVRFDTGCLVDPIGSAVLQEYKFRFDLGAEESVGGLVLQTTGLPVLAGVSAGQIVLVRVVVNRLGFVFLDSGFGLSGRASLDLGSNEGVSGLAQQADGKLIVSGTVDRPGSSGSDFFVARLTPNGQLDAAFGSGGVAFADFGGIDTARALAVRADGTIALAGDTNGPGGIQFAVAQFTPSGSPDAAFHGNGRAVLKLAGQDVAQAITFVGGQRLVVGGYSAVFNLRQFMLAAFETTPLPDLDDDGITDVLDTCPYYPDPGQADTDLDRRGDACECTDQNGDGLNTVADLIAINVAIFDPAQMTPLCDGNNDGRCNVSDILAANVEIFSPGSTSTCARQPVPGP
jgi:uncharacterized delta-60 repeat protein